MKDKNMFKYISQLVSNRFSLSLVVRERRGAGVIAYIVPSHLVGDPVVNAMDRSRMAPQDGKFWYPLVESENTLEALTALETSISTILSRVRNDTTISVEKFAAMTWNTAVAAIQHKEQVRSVTAILKMEDISQLIPPDKPDPPCCGI